MRAALLVPEDEVYPEVEFGRDDVALKGCAVEAHKLGGGGGPRGEDDVVDDLARHPRPELRPVGRIAQKVRHQEELCQWAQVRRVCHQPPTGRPLAAPPPSLTRRQLFDVLLEGRRRSECTRNPGGHQGHRSMGGETWVNGGAGAGARVRRAHEWNWRLGRSKRPSMKDRWYDCHEEVWRGARRINRDGQRK